MSATELHLAAFDGDSDAINRLLSEGAEVNARTNRGETPLVLAVGGGKVEAVRTLLKWGADVNIVPDDDPSALRSAVRSGYAEIARLLFAKGADPALVSPPKPITEEISKAGQEAAVEFAKELRKLTSSLGVPIPGDTPLANSMADATKKNAESSPEAVMLKHAIQSGDKETLMLVLEKGYSPKKVESEEKASLVEMARLMSSNLETVRLLLQYGASPDGIGADTPLKMAIVRGDIDFARVLLDAGANPEQGQMGISFFSLALATENMEMAEFLLSRNIGVNEQIRISESSLSYEMKQKIAKKRGVAWLDAVREGDQKSVQGALRSGVDINVVDEKEDTALLLATKRGDVSMMRLLLDAGADIHQSTKYDAPIHTAARQESVEAVQLLIERGADIAKPNRFHQTPLYIAAMGNRSEIADLFLAKGLRLNVVEAILLRRLDIAEERFTDGTPLDFVTEAGMTPLHAAIAIGDEALVTRLLDQGVDINTVTEYRSTPLEVAVSTENLPLIRFLLKRGAAIAGGKDSLSNPLPSAALGWNEPITRFLLEQGAPLDEESPRLNRASQQSRDEYKRQYQILPMVLSTYRFHRENKDQKSIPQWADTSRLWTIVRTLIEFGADINGIDLVNCSVLANLIEVDAPLELIRSVIEQGADVQPAETLDRETILQIATRKNRPEIVALLKQYGAIDKKRNEPSVGLELGGMNSFFREAMSQFAPSSKPETKYKFPDMAPMRAMMNTQREKRRQQYRAVLEAEVRAGKEGT